MPVAPCDFKYGVMVIVSFLVLVAMTSIYFPRQIENTEYHNVDSSVLLENSNYYEHTKISMAVTISDTNNESTPGLQFIETEERIILLVPNSFPNLSVGDRVSIRGISYLSSRGYIEVTELHIHDYPISGFSRSLLHSIPGILAFIVIFFAIFRFDTDQLRFVLRRD